MITITNYFSEKSTFGRTRQGDLASFSIFFTIFQIVCFLLFVAPYEYKFWGPRASAMSVLLFHVCLLKLRSKICFFQLFSFCGRHPSAISEPPLDYSSLPPQTFFAILSFYFLLVGSLPLALSKPSCFFQCSCFEITYSNTKKQKLIVTRIQAVICNWFNYFLRQYFPIFLLHCLHRPV